MSGRTLAIGDIHGCYLALERLLQELRITPEDTVVILGDVIDRGPGSRAVVRRLINLQKECQLRYIMGNHEEMLLLVLRKEADLYDWLRWGGRECLQSYGVPLEEFPDEDIQFMAAGLPYWETPTELFIHANLEPGTALEKQTSEWLRWMHLTGLEMPLATGQRVICGHTSQKGGVPLVEPGWVCIDTHAYGGRWLTCLDVATNEIFQANQAGKFQHSQLFL